jgi:type I restriction enzyme S subunit
MTVQPEVTPFRYLRVLDMSPDGVAPENVQFITRAAHEAVQRYVITSDDVYLSIAGTIGRAGMVPTSLSGSVLTENAAKVVVTSDRLHPRFLMYFLRSPQGQAAIAARTVGTSQQKLALERIRTIPVPIQPVEAQESVVAILSAYDDLIENNKRRLKILEEMAQRIYREWFVHFRHPGHESAGTVNADLGTIPEGWRWARLGDLTREVRESVDPAELDPETPYVGLEHMPQRSIALANWGAAKEAGSRKTRFQAGDVLFGKIRPYFHKVSVPPVAGICSTDAIVLRPRDDLFGGLSIAVTSSEAFVAYASQTAQGTKMPRADWKVLADYPVPVAGPPVLEKFNAIVLNHVALIHSLILSNRALKESRDLLLPHLVSGEIDVTDLDIEVPGAA